MLGHLLMFLKNKLLKTVSGLGQHFIVIIYFIFLILIIDFSILILFKYLLKFNASVHLFVHICLILKPNILVCVNLLPPHCLGNYVVLTMKSLN